MPHESRKHVLYTGQNRCRGCNDRLTDGPVFMTAGGLIYCLDCARQLFPEDFDAAIANDGTAVAGSGSMQRRGESRTP